MATSHGLSGMVIAQRFVARCPSMYDKVLEARKALPGEWERHAPLAPSY
ncbi:hypothetical protein [Rhodanobacter sp. BL-MT-08]